MNRIAYLTIALSVLFCAISCVEKLNTEILDEADYITVTSEVDSHTKAGYEGTSVLPSSFYMTIKQGTASGTSYTMTKVANSVNKYSFPNNQTPTWTATDVSQISIKAITTPSVRVGSKTYGYTSSTGAMKVCIDQSTTTYIEAGDLLGAKTGDGITISGNNINVAFNHLMSKLQVSYASSLQIDKIELANVAIQGTYSYSAMKHTYPNSQSSIGTITMYTSGNTAEAIFFPFDPEEINTDIDPELRLYPELRIYIKGNTTPLTKKINLRSGARFNPGKLYMMKISVSGNTDEDVTVENWGANSNIQVPGERVLWVGTSIPAGCGYPEMVAEALNCTVINNAVGGSRLLGVPDGSNGKNLFYEPFSWIVDKLDYETFPEHGWNHLAASGLSQTKSEAEKYENKLMTLSNNNSSWVTREIQAIQALSYEELIIPYIDGTKDNCTTVIIDHGFNDLAGTNILNGLHWEAGGNVSPTDHVYGSDYLLKLKNKDVTYEEYVDFVNNHDYLYPQSSYIISMKRIVDAIRAVNPNIRIIIGNYFTMDSPYVNTKMYPGEKYTGIICYFNEAVAGLFDLDIVNVQKYLWIEESQFWAGLNGAGEVIYDPTKFCPDGVHPTNPDAARAIADIYIRELDGVIGSRVN